MKIELEERIHLIEKEIDALEDGMNDSKLSLKAGIDEIKIEIEAIKGYLREIHPDFKNKFSVIKKKIILEKNPEWISEDE
ncbi:MAG: hypothetical protein HY578_05075 [Nitrospinae bacterium]|nr:hypothetical protein [Nitrospinota bacterium]